MAASVVALALLHSREPAPAPPRVAKARHGVRAEQPRRHGEDRQRRFALRGACTQPSTAFPCLSTGGVEPKPRRRIGMLNGREG